MGALPAGLVELVADVGAGARAAGLDLTGAYLTDWSPVVTASTPGEQSAPLGHAVGLRARLGPEGGLVLPGARGATSLLSLRVLPGLMPDGPRWQAYTFLTDIRSGRIVGTGRSGFGSEPQHADEAVREAFARLGVADGRLDAAQSLAGSPVAVPDRPVGPFRESAPLLAPDAAGTRRYREVFDRAAVALDGEGGEIIDDALGRFAFGPDSAATAASVCLALAVLDHLDAWPAGTAFAEDGSVVEAEIDGAAGGTNDAARPDAPVDAARPDAPVDTARPDEAAATGQPGPWRYGSDPERGLGLDMQSAGAVFWDAPTRSAVEMAIDEINEAGGVLGQDVFLPGADEAGDAAVASMSVDRLLADNAHAIIGAAASGMSLAVIDKIVGSGVLQCPASNTAPVITDYPDVGLYFRTAPGDRDLRPATTPDFGEAGAVFAADKLGWEVDIDLFEGGFTLPAPVLDTDVTSTVLFDPQANALSAEVEQRLAGKPDAVVAVRLDDGASTVGRVIESGPDAPPETAEPGSDGRRVPTGAILAGAGALVIALGVWAVTSLLGDDEEPVTAADVTAPADGAIAEAEEPADAEPTDVVLDEPFESLTDLLDFAAQYGTGSAEQIILALQHAAGQADATLLPAESQLRDAIDDIPVSVWELAPGPTVHSADQVPPAEPSRPETRMRAAGDVVIDPGDDGGGWAQAAFGNTVFPCGPGPVAVTVCPDEEGRAAPAGGSHLVVFASFAADIVLEPEAGSLYTYGFAFDGDGDASNNYIPHEAFPNDFFAGTDHWFTVEWGGAGWRLAVTSVRDGAFESLASAARAIVLGDTVALVVPLSEFEVAAPPYRVTSFWHLGDFGMGSPHEWSGHVQPPVSEGLVTPASGAVSVPGP